MIKENCMDKIKQINEAVQKVIDSDYSANHIEVETGVARSTITRIRNNERTLNGTTWKVIQKLYKFSKERNL